MKLTTIILAATISSYAAAQTPKTFNVDKYIPFMQMFQTIDVNNDGYPDAIQAMYDLNSNGVHDACAFYKITGIDPFNGDYITRENATIVILHDENNKNINYVLYDTDGNGTLDKKEKLKTSKLEERIIKI